MRILVAGFLLVSLLPIRPLGPHPHQTKAGEDVCSPSWKHASGETRHMERAVLLPFLLSEMPS